MKWLWLGPLSLDMEIAEQNRESRAVEDTLLNVLRANVLWNAA